MPTTEERSALRAYLRALQEDGSAPSHIRRDLEFYEGKVEEFDEKVNNETDPLRQLELVQERKTWVTKRDERAEWEQREDPSALEDGFIEYAAAYAERKGIEWDSFRAMGVPASVLERAKIPQHA